MEEHIRRGNTGRVRELLQSNANPNYVLNDYTTLMCAVEHNQCSIVSVLLDFKADPNYRNRFNQTVLTSAVLKPDIGILQILLKSKADPNFVDNKGFTPLGYALMDDDHEKALCLLEASANPNTPLHQNAPLDVAVSMMNMDTVQSLLKFGASPDTPMPKVIHKLSTPTLTLTVSPRDFDLCRLLLFHGAVVKDFEKQMMGTSTLFKMYCTAALADELGVPRQDALAIHPQLISLQATCICSIAQERQCIDLIASLRAKRMSS